MIVRFVDIGGIVDHHYLHFCWEWRQLPGADPGFQVRGGALKINCAERREARKCLGYFVWKITILRQKIILFPILGGAHPPLDPPLVTSLKQRAFYIYTLHMAIYQELSFLAITLMWDQGTITLVDHVLMVEVEFVHLSLCDLYVNTQWASDWLVFNTKWTVFQLYHDESTYLVSEWLVFNTKWTVFQL